MSLNSLSSQTISDSSGGHIKSESCTSMIKFSNTQTPWEEDIYQTKATEMKIKENKHLEEKKLRYERLEKS